MRWVWKFLRITLADKNKGLCHKWQSAPKGKDYLATCIKTLKRLYAIAVAGCRLNRKYLTSTHLQLDRSKSSLFEPCKTPGEYICDCTRLQRICKRLPVGDVSPGHLVDNGAVTIGQSRSQSERIIQGLIKEPQPKQNGIYSQPSIYLMPVTSHCDPEEVSISYYSDSDSLLQTSSDETKHQYQPQRPARLRAVYRHL